MITIVVMIILLLTFMFIKHFKQLKMKPEFSLFLALIFATTLFNIQLYIKFTGKYDSHRIIKDFNWAKEDIEDDLKDSEHMTNIGHLRLLGSDRTHDGPLAGQVDWGAGESITENDVNIQERDGGPDWKRILWMPTEGFHSFNTTASDEAGNLRPVPDSRPGDCKKLMYDVTDLPTVSVIIPFHNEARSTLLRTVHSVLVRTPRSLLQEVLLVDDASTYDWLLEPLNDYVEHLPKVRVIRPKSRQGLIRARLEGAKAATGQVLFFMDSHCEVNHMWIEPLLQRIKEKRDTVIIPLMEGIAHKDMDYIGASGVDTGTFGWDLIYNWRRLSDEEISRRDNKLAPILTPAMVGCAFGINRDYFFEIGAYDEKMDIWGGENVEHSFRIWMCGGSIEILPCCRVAHLFKPKLPYSFPGDSARVIQRNMIRVAEVWMDDYKKYYYATQSKLIPIDYESLEERKKLRRDLKCKSFDWFLKNIAPEVEIPPSDAMQFGQMTHEGSKECIARPSEEGHLTRTTCWLQGAADRIFAITSDGKFRFGEGCIVPTLNGVKYQRLCREEHNVWEFVESSRHIKLRHNDQCLTSRNETFKTQLCDPAREDQKYMFGFKLNFKQNMNIQQISHEHMKRPKEAIEFGMLANSLKVKQNRDCVSVLDDGTLSIVPCSKQPNYLKVLHLDRDKSLRVGAYCLAGKKSELKTLKCPRIINNKGLMWNYTHYQQLKLQKRGRCLMLLGNGEQKTVQFAKCDENELKQKWVFEKVPDT
ncbi:unnamed protein product [Owenia fusiformis]|uniref:Polypeptide N-acetylgalactosaminyltransferase n=1 Tax=Owenia fusiformis TaxID=6347 RepID=A0A8J1XSF3_OWEFU|nr:unnamed protein product [Owenia fusiformis]